MVRPKTLTDVLRGFEIIQPIRGTLVAIHYTTGRAAIIRGLNTKKQQQFTWNMDTMQFWRL